MIFGRRKSVKKKTIINVKQKRKSTDETVSHFADGLYKKINAGVLMNEIPFQDTKDLRDLLLFILEKPLRNQNDMIVIRYYLTNFPGFISTLNLAENFHDPQEIMQKISVFLEYERLKQNQIVCLNGQLGDKFYLIIDGCVAVLVPVNYTMMMTTDEFMGYLYNLYELREYDLIHKSISSNRKYLDSSYTKQIIDLEKQCQNFKNLTNYINEEIPIFEYINRLIPIETTKDSKDSHEFVLWKYIRVVDLESGKSFGDVALKDNISKRTATIITVKQSFFGTIKKDIYQVCIRDALERVRRYNMETIYNTNIFNDYSKELFKVYIFNHFKACSIQRGKYLFKQGDEREEIYFIKTGEFKVDLFSSCEELNDIIDSFGGDSYNRDLKIKIELNYKLKNFNKEKRNFYVFFVKRGDVLGMDDYLVNGSNKFFASVKCFSKSAEYFSVNLDFFNKILKDKLIKKNFENWIKIRKQIMVNRLIELKNNSLYHFYSMVGDKDMIYNFKEEEKNISRNNVKVLSTHLNEDTNFNDKNISIPNAKVSFASFKKFLFPKKTSKKIILNDSQSKSKIRNSSSDFITKSNTINQLDNNKKTILKNTIEPTNKIYLSPYDYKPKTVKNSKPNVTFGNFNVNKKEIPRLKLYNTVINKLVSEKDAICSNQNQSLHSFDILAMDKYIENTQTERELQKNPNYIKYYSNYYEYVNSDKYNKINNLFRITKNKKFK